MANRRTLITQGISIAVLSGLSGAGAPVWALPAKRLQFPRDHGAHPDFRTEWWYITGYANTAQGEAAYGYQITFFRSRVGTTQNMRSTLAARHLLFAHAAITDVAGKKLWHDQRIARWSGEAPRRNAADVASAATTGMEINLRDWHLVETGSASGSQITTEIASDTFGLNLQFTQTQNLLLQGDAGLSRKGPEPGQASYYYSRPQLRAEGTLTLKGRTVKFQSGSTAWLDHEWSQELLHPQAVGWDWIGINMHDGGALTAFQLRDGQGQALWYGGSFRGETGASTSFRSGDVEFKPLRFWRSVLSGASYPVEWRVRTPQRTYTVHAMVDDQELDSRASTGSIYWEGLCEVRDLEGHRVGRGYLEMTGYAGALKMS